MFSILHRREHANRVVTGARITWRVLPNATSYEIWRGGKRVATTTHTSYRGGSRRYRARGLNPLGAGPFGLAH